MPRKNRRLPEIMPNRSKLAYKSQLKKNGRVVKPYRVQDLDRQTTREKERETANAR